MKTMLASTDVLQVVLGEAHVTSQLACNASWVDQNGSGNNFPALTNDTTPVTLVASPTAGTERIISALSIVNSDTVQHQVILNLVRSGSPSELVKIGLMPGYRLAFDGDLKVYDANGNFLCNVTVSGGTITSNQGTAAAITAPWPVQLSNGTNAVGTSSTPLRIDPTGTTTQPVNITQIDGSALGGPTAWGVAPSAGTEVINVNANIVAGGGGGGASNITEWSSVALGSPSVYGTSPGAVDVIGVNAYVTNTVPVTGSFYPATQPVSIATLPALSAGSSTIGAVTQGGAPWSNNVSQWGGTATSLGQKVSASSVPMVLASDYYPAGAASVTLTGTTAQTFAAATTVVIRSISVTSVGAVLAAGTVAIEIVDGGGTTRSYFVVPTAVTTAAAPWTFDFQNLATPLVNGGNVSTIKLSANLTSGAFVVAFSV